MVRATFNFKKYFLVVLFLYAFVQVSAQKIYFVLLQSEKSSPFYVKMDERVYQSNSSGYLVLSNLVEKKYSIQIGTQPNKVDEISFSFTINGKDKGYLIKNNRSAALSLVDLQTDSIVSTSEIKSNIAESIYKKESSTFTELLVKAVGDSTFLLETPMLFNESIKEQVSEKKLEQKQEVQQVDSIAKESPQDSKIAVAKQIEIPEIINPSEHVEKEKNYVKSTVKFHSESSTTEGFGLIFFDSYEDGTMDTIKILIPNSSTKLIFQNADPKEAKDSLKFIEIIQVETSSREAVDQVQPISTNRIAKKDTVENLGKQIAKNTDCLPAFEEDFLLLRKKMAAALNDSGMLDEASVQFKEKCFTTLQIKNLSVLFLTDGGKYNFLTLAVHNVSDRDKFNSLQSIFTEAAYLQKFQSLIK